MKTDRRSIVKKFLAFFLSLEGLEQILQRKKDSKLIYVFCQIYSPTLSLGDRIVSLQDLPRYHKRLKKNILGKIVGVVDEFRFIVLIEFNPSVLYSIKNKQVC